MAYIANTASTNPTKQCFKTGVLCLSSLWGLLQPCLGAPLYLIYKWCFFYGLLSGPYGYFEAPRSRIFIRPPPPPSVTRPVPPDGYFQRLGGGGLYKSGKCKVLIFWGSDLFTRMLCTFCLPTILGDFYRIPEKSPKSSVDKINSLRACEYRENPKRRFSQKTADFRRFTPSLRNSSIWRAQEAAADFCRKPKIFRRTPQETADWAPSPLARPNKSRPPPPRRLSFPENPYPPNLGGGDSPPKFGGWIFKNPCFTVFSGDFTP